MFRVSARQVVNVAVQKLQRFLPCCRPHAHSFEHLIFSGDFQILMLKQKFELVLLEQCDVGIVVKFVKVAADVVQDFGEPTLHLQVDAHVELLTSRSVEVWDFPEFSRSFARANQSVELRPSHHVVRVQGNRTNKRHKCVVRVVNCQLVKMISFGLLGLLLLALYFELSHGVQLFRALHVSRDFKLFLAEVVFVLLNVVGVIDQFDLDFETRVLVFEVTDS